MPIKLPSWPKREKTHRRWIASANVMIASVLLAAVQAQVTVERASAPKRRAAQQISETLKIASQVGQKGAVIICSFSPFVFGSLPVELATCNTMPA